MDIRNSLKNLMYGGTNELGRQFRGVRGLMNTNYKTPAVTNPQDRRQRMLRNMLVGRRPV